MPPNLLDILENSHLMGSRQTLNIITAGSVKTERLQHGLIIKPVQINSLSGVSKVLVLVPGRNTKGVAFPPLEFLSSNLAMSTTLDYVIH